MAQPIYANNVAGLLAANIGPSDTAILLGAGQGSLFPPLPAGNWYYVTLVHATLATIEIVKVTAKAVDTLTVVRGQDGTSAASFTIGSVAEMRLTAQTLREVDYRNAAGIANGLATLDGASKLTASQLPTNVPTTTGGKLDIAVIPDDVVVSAELTAGLNTKVNRVGDIMSGALHYRVGPAATQTLMFSSGRGDNVQRWAQYLEVDGSYKSFAYNADGSFSASGLHLSVLGAGGVNKITFMEQNVWWQGNFDPATKLNVNNPSINGTTSSNGSFVTSNGRYIGGTDVVLAANGGGVYLRPHGSEVATNQGILQPSGLLQVVDVQSYSDKRRKKFIRKAKPLVLTHLLALKTWVNKADNTTGCGLIAQELQAAGGGVFVGVGPKGELSINYAGVALNGVLEHEQRLQQIEKTLNQLIDLLNAKPPKGKNRSK